jgi:hypothetical protein
MGEERERDGMGWGREVGGKENQVLIQMYVLN